MDILDKLEAASQPIPQTAMGNATVTNAAAGTFTDGRKKITINWLGVTFDAAYGAAYTPALNDVVLFTKNGSSVTVIDKIAR